MGMICDLFAVPDETARDLLANPERIHRLLDTLEQDDASVCLEKSWHGLHFVLTNGSAWADESPLDFLAAGGVPVGEEDVGYGPARVLLPNDVVRLNAALSALTDAEFARRFDLKGLEDADIYPQIWDEPLEDLLEEYGDYFRATKALVQRAAQEGLALLVTIR